MNKIVLMRKEDKDEVYKMMEVFYSSDAVYTNGSKDIFINDITNCINDNPYLEGYVFKEANVIKGYAMLAKSFSTEFGKPCIWIEDIYIKEEYRKSGIGSMFFEYIFDKYKDVIFRLEAEKENNIALSLYKKCGFDILPYLELKKDN